MTKKSRRVAKARRALLALSLVLVTMMVAVGGTIAWLTATSGEVVNTFTSSNVGIELKEHDYVLATDELDMEKEVTTESEYKMIPGDTLPKDPFVRVLTGSEDCFVFVKIEESSTLDTYISYEIGAKWTAVPNATGVYYYDGNEAENATTIAPVSAGTTLGQILANDQVTVNTSVTKAQMEALNATGAVQPTLTFTAYAIQSDYLVDDDDNAVTAPEDIWTLAQKQ